MQVEVSFLSTIRDNPFGINLKELIEIETFHSNFDEKSELERWKFESNLIIQIKFCAILGVIKKKKGSYYLCNELENIRKNDPADFWNCVNEMIKTRKSRKLLIKNGKKNHKNQ